MRGAMLGAAVGAPFGFAIAGMLDAGNWMYVIAQSVLVFGLAFVLRSRPNSARRGGQDRGVPIRSTSDHKLHVLRKSTGVPEI